MNFQIRNRLVDVLRQSIVERKYIEQLGIQFKGETQSGNYMDGNKIPSESEGEANPQGIINKTIESDFSDLTAVLTDKQKVWFDYAIVEGLSNQEIAEKEQISLEAVKSWAKSAKRKLRNLDWEKQ